MIVYLITNNVNGKKYVGQSETNLEARWDRHVTSSRNPKSRVFKKMLIVRAIAKYGPTNFDRKVIEECDTYEAMNTAEIRWIAELGTMDLKVGYNLTPGGDRPPSRLGSTHSTETRAKISRAGCGRRNSPEHCERIRRALKGRRLGKHVPGDKRKPLLALDDSGTPIITFPTLLDAKAYAGYRGPPYYFKIWIDRGRVFNGLTFVLTNKTVKQLKAEGN